MPKPKLTPEARAERKAIADYLLRRGDAEHEKSRLAARDTTLLAASRDRLADFYFARSDGFYAACAEVRKGTHTKRSNG